MKMRECGDETLTEITYLVLLAFYRPNHGYGVMQFLEEHTKGRVKPGAGTLYGAINSLVKKEWIKPYAQEDRKKIYLITDLGKIILEKEVMRLRQNYTLGNQTIYGGDEYECS